MKKVMHLAFFTLFFLPLMAQSRKDTLQLTLVQADSLLIRNNLSLIAATYEVDASRAQIIQARLFSNPVLSGELSLYNPVKEKWFDVGPTGNKSFSLSQVFQVAGQRNTSIKLAREASKMTEFEYADLARTLKFQLHQSYFTVFFLEQGLRIIDRQLSMLDETIRAYKGQYLKGNITLKDYSRLEASYIQLSNDKLDMIARITENRKTLDILLAAVSFVIPSPSPAELAKYRSGNLNLNDLLGIASANRPDLDVSASRIRQEELNLSLQKRLGIPDLTMGLTYDQSGNYVQNYNAVTFSFPMPLLNHNKGNIKTAEAMLNEARSAGELSKATAVAEVTASYSKLIGFVSEMERTDPSFMEQITQLSQGILDNYKRKNISLLEFTDLFEAYSQAVINYYQLKTSSYSAFEELNYTVGKELFN